MNSNNIYLKLIETAKNREYPVVKEMHHIIPKCLGGSDHADNLVALTPKEHYVAHHLLYKIHNKNHKLAFAWFCMSRNNKNQSRISIRQYGLAKKAMIAACASREIHRCHIGKTIVHNILTQQEKFIDKNDKLPEGFRFGRSPNFILKIKESRKLPSARFWNKEQQKLAASNASKGKFWFYNPTTGENKRAFVCPSGFIAGSRKWYTNGIESKQFIENHQDDGWTRGRTMKWRK